jgi:metal-responsive CopG/Arc/MetJ family transcriptional regulator
MRVRIPLIIEESLIKEIDEIAGEKHRRAATIETALREYIARQARKAKANPESEAASPAPVRGTARSSAVSAAKSAARANAAPPAKATARAKR